MTTEQVACYHCGLAVPDHTHFELEIEGVQQSFCCPGCQAVAAAIVSGGLSGFYRFRTENNPRPTRVTPDFSAFDLPDVQAEFVFREHADRARASLLLEGISCAACVWLIEQHLGCVEGVASVRVNASTHRCVLEWDPGVVPLSQLMGALEAIGYPPLPATRGRQQALRETENRRALMRLAVAGFGMMQVGMVAVALYAGADDNWRQYFRWLSLLIATPVVIYSAGPFFTAAARNLRMKHLTMDVPVAVAIGGAYLASVWATVSGSGEVYFDSVSMFTFFLLLGRYLEMRARHRNGIDTDRFAQMLPMVVERLDADGSWRSASLNRIAVGDRILVASGACVPCDGVVREGSSGVVESLLTGEADAVEKRPGDLVIAGSTNTDSALQIEVSAVGSGTRLSAIERMVDSAVQEKPSQVALADRLASYFVAAVLVISTLVALVWWQLDPQRALWVTLSVLVVTCPCALSLASPTALTVAVNWLRRHGLLITRGHVLEGLNSVDRVVFDKTGTLTLGRPQIMAVVDSRGRELPSEEKDRLLGVCAALEVGSTHPIASAFADFQGRYRMRDITQVTGQGVRGYLAEAELCGHWSLGRPDLARTEHTPPHDSGQWLLLARERQGDQARVCAWIRLQDSLRPSARNLVPRLEALGLRCELLSGDGAGEVRRVAGELGFRDWQSDCDPDTKLGYISKRQTMGERVLMVGDGINDVPVLSGAFISVAMGGSSDLAKTHADSVLLSGDLSALERAFACARLTRRVIRQNLGWAAGYNLMALPLAALGWVPPWAAAIGMSGSSLVVVGNALRIGRSP